MRVRKGKCNSLGRSELLKGWNCPCWSEFSLRVANQLAKRVHLQHLIIPLVCQCTLVIFFFKKNTNSMKLYYLPGGSSDARENDWAKCSSTLVSVDRIKFQNYIEEPVYKHYYSYIVGFINMWSGYFVLVCVDHCFSSMLPSLNFLITTFFINRAPNWIVLEIYKEKICL